MLLTPLYRPHFASIPHTLPTSHISNICIPILLVSYFVLTLACDRSTLPSGARISQRGPVLKLVCPYPLRSMEVFNETHVKSAAVRFTRYMCIDGKTFHQIGVDGIQNSTFFCNDRRRNSCSLLIHSSLEGNLYQPTNLSVFIWQPHNGNSSVLYCVFGNWHRLGGGNLPKGIIVNQNIKPQTDPSIPRRENTSFITSSTLPPPPPIPPEKRLSKFYRFYLDQLFHAPSAAPPTPDHHRIASTQPHIHRTSSAILSEHYQIWNDFSEEELDRVSQIVHRFARIALICLIVMSLIGTFLGIVFFCFLRHRRKYVDIEAGKATENLKQVIALV